MTKKEINMIYKRKCLYSIIENKINIVIRLIYNTNTNNITISTNCNKYNYKIRPTNKQCATYLGVTCAEQVLSKVFKNIEIMPYGNKGFDFICGKGFKVDSKASCKAKNENCWLFSIRKNKIPDYFALIAFDNRDDLTPKYFWLIPGHVINDKTGIGIYESTLSKYDEYRQDINKVIKCCNNLQGK